VKANGEKLPPKVICKGVSQLKIKVPPRMQVSVYKKGWMDDEGILMLPSFQFFRKLSSQVFHDASNY